MLSNALLLSGVEAKYYEATSLLGETLTGGGCRQGQGTSTGLGPGPPGSSAWLRANAPSTLQTHGCFLLKVSWAAQRA